MRYAYVRFLVFRLVSRSSDSGGTGARAGAQDVRVRELRRCQPSRRRFPARSLSRPSRRGPQSVLPAATGAAGLRAAMGLRASRSNSSREALSPNWSQAARAWRLSPSLAWAKSRWRFRGWYRERAVLALDPDALLGVLLARIEADPEVQYAQPNVRMRPYRAEAREEG